MATSLQASTAHGRHGVLVIAATHIMALVLIGALGPPDPAESPVGISENDRGVPQAFPTICPHCDCSASSPRGAKLLVAYAPL